jgi:TolA-binding protein
MEIVPDSATNGEAPFWVGITLADQGRIDDAIPYLRRAYRQHEDWARLVPRLPDAGLLESEALADRLVEAMREDQ